MLADERGGERRVGITTGNQQIEWSRSLTFGTQLVFLQSHYNFCFFVGDFFFFLFVLLCHFWSNVSHLLVFPPEVIFGSSIAFMRHNRKAGAVLVLVSGGRFTEGQFTGRTQFGSIRFDSFSNSVFVGLGSQKSQRKKRNKDKRVSQRASRRWWECR